ncbi:MAG TPA: restriction endonuclease subunit S, partial [Devosia sp.]
MTDIAELVAGNIDIWTGAIQRKTGAGRGGGKRISLYGIERLRALILDLAVRGKLVPQDVTDEPASDLLKRIAESKAAMIRDGVIRKPRDVESKNNLKQPFSIPNTWQWVRLDQVGAIIGGGTPSSNDAACFAESGTGIAWLTPADLGGFTGRYIAHGARDLTDFGLRSSSATLMPAGSVLFTSRAPIGYVAIAERPVTTNQGFKSVVPFISDCSLFVATALKSFAKSINDNAPGTTFKEVSGKIVSSIPFPLPPLAEQRRIVAKVDELMALCDALERESADAMASHQALVEALLATLVNSADASDLAHQWARLESHLDTLFTTDASIEALKQTILDLAVRGKLVEQDSRDEVASSLVQDWKKAKSAALISAGDRRIKAAPDPKFPPFPLPSHWGFQSFENIFLFIDYRGNTPPKTSEGIPLITAKNVRMGYLDREPREFISEATFPKWMTRGFPRIDDLFFTTEAPLGNVCQNDVEEPFAIAQRLICFQPYGDVNTRFFMLAIMSRSMQQVLDDHATGMTARGM